jgi:hypothetical protein
MSPQIDLGLPEADISELSPEIAVRFLTSRLQESARVCALAELSYLHLDTLEGWFNLNVRTALISDHHLSGVAPKLERSERSRRRQTLPRRKPELTDVMRLVDQRLQEMACFSPDDRHATYCSFLAFASPRGEIMTSEAAIPGWISFAENRRSLDDYFNPDEENYALGSLPIAERWRLLDKERRHQGIVDYAIACARG